MKTALCSHAELTGALKREVLEDRRAQFVDRMSWRLSVDAAGLEADEYDDSASTYLVVSSGGRHAASCRLRPFSAPTMLLDHFTAAFPSAGPYVADRPGQLFEITRFLKSPDLGEARGWAALEAIAEGLSDARRVLGADGFLAVVFRPVSRLLSYQAADFHVIERGRIDGKGADLIFMAGIPMRHRRRDIPVPTMKNAITSNP